MRHCHHFPGKSCNDLTCLKQLLHPVRKTLLSSEKNHFITGEWRHLKKEFLFANGMEKLGK